MQKRKIRKMMGAGLFVLGFALSLRANERSREPLYANDLGPSEIDVSKYPARMQMIYREKFEPLCSACHTAARAVNSEFLEMDEPALAGLRRQQPELFADAHVLMADKDIWKRYIKQMKMRPPCCGACPLIKQADAKEVWQFLVYDSIQRKTGANATAWQSGRRALLQEFSRRYPQTYKYRYQ